MEGRHDTMPPPFQVFLSRVFKSRVCLRTAGVVMHAILVFAGSARANAFPKKLAKSAALIIRRRTPVKAMVRSHDGLLIAAPEFNGFIPQLLVNLFSVDLALRGADIPASIRALGNGGDRCVIEILRTMNARRLATDVLYQFICSLCAANGFLIHLHSIKVTMSQKSSTLNSENVPQSS